MHDSLINQSSECSEDHNPNGAADRTADQLPARMVNEYVYCPRLFYYMHIEGVFVENQETVEGENLHTRVDTGKGEFPAAETLAEQGEQAKARSVTMGSDTYGVTAKMDLLEIHPLNGDSAAGSVVVPVDYKRGRPMQHDDGSLSAWPTDRVQLGIQALILRDNGYDVREAIVYYATTRQRVRFPVDEQLVQETLAAIDGARKLQEEEPPTIPLPLVDSPKCPRCSLVTVCLPDETHRMAAYRHDSREMVQRFLFDVEPLPDAVAEEEASPAKELRRLVPARDERRPLYLNTQGYSVGRSGEVLVVKEKGVKVQEVRILDICQVNLFGSIQLTTQAIQTLCEADVPIAYFSMGGWFYGVTRGLSLPNIVLRREQFRWADSPTFCLRFARALVAGKIRNQRTMLMRNHVEPPPHPLSLLKCFQQDAQRATSLSELLGMEGNAARIYFEHFAGMIKSGDRDLPSDPDDEIPMSGPTSEEGQSSTICPTSHSSSHNAPTIRTNSEDPSVPHPDFTFDFRNRNRRPPRDPVNALLSLAYSLLTKDLTISAFTVGLDPFQGYYHQVRHGRAALALDLMEPFRPLVADSAVLTAINTRMITLNDFVRAGNSVSLTPTGRKKFYHAYEQRMDTLVTHPLFGYRVSYRRLLDIQTRLLARVLTGEIREYPVFTTR